MVRKGAGTPSFQGVALAHEGVAPARPTQGGGEQSTRAKLLYKFRWQGWWVRQGSSGGKVGAVFGTGPPSSAKAGESGVGIQEGRREEF